MKAIGQHIIITPIKEELKKSKGGLLLTEEALEVRYSKGKVITPGTHCQVIKPEDIIYYDKHAGHVVEFEGEMFTVIQERDVVIVV